VYSPSRGEPQHTAIFSALDSLLKSIPEPNGFVLQSSNPRDYFYTKKLSPLDAERLCDAKFLTQYFDEPLNSAIA
jgi:hypothetical protein